MRLLLPTAGYDQIPRLTIGTSLDVNAVTLGTYLGVHVNYANFIYESGRPGQTKNNIETVLECPMSVGWSGVRLSACPPAIYNEQVTTCRMPPMPHANIALWNLCNVVGTHLRVTQLPSPSRRDRQDRARDSVTLPVSHSPLRWGLLRS
jgi:hypothetical protein